MSTHNGRISHTAMVGIKDLPSNTAWLLSKALKPVAQTTVSATSHLSESVTDLASSAVEGAGEGAKHTAGMMMNSISSRGSVAQLMQKAEEAATRAQESEARALALAQRAEQQSEAAAQVVAEATATRDQARQEAKEQIRARVERARHEASAAVAEVTREQQERVNRAQSGADHHIESVRMREEAAARKNLEKIEGEAGRRASDAKRQAKESQARAASAIEEANAAIAHARDLATEAAAAAQEAAVEATREAERLAEEAKQRANDAKRQAVAAGKVRDRAGRDSQQGNPKQAGPKQSVAESDSLLALRKPDLVAVAQAVDIEGATQMSKSELAAALAEVNVPLETLHKRDLVRLAESQGLDVRSSMSKQELIDSMS